MVPLFLGISFMIQAILHRLGWKYMISKKMRNVENRVKYQHSLALPYMILGIGWVILSILHPDHNSYSYCIGLIVIGIIPFNLMMKNKKKYIG